MKIGFVFVLYKTPSSEKNRLDKEVNQLGFIDPEIIFIDNTNTDKGYAAGVNKGIKILIKKGYDTFVIANPDISLKGLQKKDISETVEKFDISSFAMVQDRKTYYCGRLDKKRLSSYLDTNPPKTYFTNCEYVTGSLMIIKKDVIEKIGLFDESYFMYYEDVDFCVRAKQNGLKVGINTEKSYEHFEVSKQNKQKNKYLFRNWIRFFIKYSSTKQKLREICRLPKTIYQNKTKIISIS